MAEASISRWEWICNQSLDSNQDTLRFIKSFLLIRLKSSLVAMNIRLGQIVFILALLLTLSCTNQVQHSEEEPVQPNIIYILADDLGYGDLSCNGQTKFQTPNIDRLAAQGMLFTQHYSGATVCAPSRSALMTGLHTGHTPIRGNKGVPPEGQYPLADSVVTLPEILQQAGYKTGAFGKWGLGPVASEGDPNNQGFDQFYGYNCQSLAHNYYPRHLWHNQNKVLLDENAGKNKEIYAPDLIQQQVISFMESNQQGPFFLYYANVIPHAELIAPEPYMEKFRGMFDPEKAYQGYDDGPKYRLGPYESQPESHAAFAAMVTYLDDCVGQILSKLEELNLTENTIIMFTSDNGPHLEGGADPDYFDSNGIYRGYKRDLYEGGIRVPMIVQWPGTVGAGTTSDHISAFWDVLPTLADLSGADQLKGIDGLSFAPTLLGQGKQLEHDYLYWEFHEKGGRRAVRKDQWKLVQYQVGNPDETTTELFNLDSDPGETTNLAEDQPEIYRDLYQKMLDARTTNPVFQFANEQ
jgi:arylsulfatase A-like enzyme